LLPSRYQFVSTPRARARTDTLRGFDGEFSVYLGVPMLALLAFAAWRLRSRRAMQVAATMFAAALVLSLGGALRATHAFSLPLPWAVANHTPVLKVALPSRLMLYAYLAAGVMLALFIDDLTTRRGRVLQRAGAAGVALVLLSLCPIPNPPSTAGPSVPPFFRTRAVALIPAGTTLLATPVYRDSIPPMAWQWSADFRFRLAQGTVFTPQGNGTPKKSPLFDVINVVEGFSLRPPPPGCEAIATSLGEACRARLLADVRTLRIGAIAVGEGPQSERLLQIFGALAGPPTSTTGGVSLWILGSPPPHAG
jgi:hypothetical protein